ncbi:MAG: TVP38/TMEM64 family protein [Desulfobacterales bacterium]|nr:MAG: TVP38/TMEM64 family protein [Desulfobacterales bacterium]
MPRTSFSAKYIILVLVAVGGGIVALLGFWYRGPLMEKLFDFYHLISDREQIRAFVASCGAGAPFVFMGIQILQVLLAPVPGEATGFIGGYLFGTVKGFILSSLGLAIGSWINFSIGRFLGKRFVRKLIPARRFARYDAMLKRQGVIVIFFLFVFPGFPKDYFCLFLGLSTLSFKVFIFLAALGRMPGTFMLSLQGSMLFEKNYIVLVVIAVIFGILAFLAYRYREAVYVWIEKFNSR